MPKILIITRGGCVLSVHASNQATVEVIDLDDFADCSVSEEIKNTVIAKACDGLENIY